MGDVQEMGQVICETAADLFSILDKFQSKCGPAAAYLAWQFFTAQYLQSKDNGWARALSLDAVDLAREYAKKTHHDFETLSIWEVETAQKFWEDAQARREESPGFYESIENPSQEF